MSACHLGPILKCVNSGVKQQAHMDAANFYKIFTRNLYRFATNAGNVLRAARNPALRAFSQKGLIK
jgi:hypothetical protein